MGCAATASAISSAGSKAPVFTLPAWMATISGPSTEAIAARAASALHAALVVRRDARDAIAPEAEVLERGEQGRVRLLADDHGDLWRAVQAIGLDVPACPREHGVARRPPARPRCRARPRSEGRSSRRRAGPSRSSIQAPATSSAAAAAGERACSAAFWPQAVVSQSAAAAAGS